MKVKHCVALVIGAGAGPGRVLLVQRPRDDEDLPGVWGLPAASLRAGETLEDAAHRAARDKLGVAIEIGAVLNDGSQDRGSHRLEMRLVEARIRSGTPRTDTACDDGTTRYQAWRWGARSELRPAAERGSLCSRLALEATD
jgi:8-oxo-dGTP diphosphatase